jgi:4-hydroxybenzoyl-CoA thioesterase
MKPFVSQHRVRFAHCDPAGIAYYPRLLEICDMAIEDWTESVLGVPRRVLHLELNLALPTVDLQATFSAPARLGERLTGTTLIKDVGHTSVALVVEMRCEEEARFSVRYKQVLMSMAEACSVPWPHEWRQRLLSRLAEETA